MPAVGPVRLLDAELPWEEIALPGARPAVRRVVLHAEGGGRPSVQAVRFPPGWARPGTGCFDADEEVVVLRGELVVSGVVMRSGDHAFLPRGVARRDSRAGDEGCLAVAWFSSVPRWRPSAGADPGPAISRHPLDRPTTSPAGHAEPSTGPADVVDPVAGTWVWVPAGESVRRPDGPALVRCWT